MISTFSFLRPPLAAVALGLAVLATTAPAPVVAQHLAGPYLASRSADFARDYDAVVTFGTRALARDPENTGLMQALIVAHAGLGQIAQAVPVARRLIELEDNNQIAGLVLLADAMQRENWQRVLELLDQGLSVGGVMDQVITAWAEMGLGQMTRALDIFSALSSSGNTAQFAAYHHALALALAGDYEGAETIFRGNGQPRALDRMGVKILAQILSQLERNDEAIDLIDEAYPDGPGAEIAELRTRLAAGETVEFDAIRSERDGLADMFYSVAQSLARDLDPQVVLLYSRTAEFLRPDLYEATMVSALLLEQLEHYGLAIETYGRIPADHPVYLLAQRSRAAAMVAQDRPEDAITLLSDLVAAHPESFDTLVALADTLRRQDRFAEALPVYDAAIALIETPEPSHWIVYFARGICNEREDRWPAAESDFRKALELSPEQPSVMNYLGYSYVEMQQNLDEALDLIQRAVAARPNDGYITDSLGWVYFRLGRYEEAVVEMERAVELMPVDPVVNDHLGDTYWAVGRRREAEFQWNRALSFITDDSDLEEVRPDRIRRKLEVGLDRVLAEEGAPPLTPADDDG